MRTDVRYKEPFFYHMNHIIFIKLDSTLVQLVFGQRRRTIYHEYQ